MSAPTIRSVRGMNDLLPPDSAKWLHVEQRCRDWFEGYGYGEIRTPVLESTSLFSRSIGDATDIVEKEMYTFADRKGRSLSLRPEMTASCARAYIQHGIGKRQPVTRWYYVGPMFRYERMQTGRYRQFYQIGVEAFGAPEPTVDAEQIAMLHRLYRDLGVTDLEVVLNSVGNAEDRPVYRAALLAFLAPHEAELCPDCQRRMKTNPLRVLDCKVPTCKQIVAGAPPIADHLGEASRAHFEGVKESLEALGIPFEVDPRLVRGLDYYTATVFELMSTSADLGTQNTLVAGGRYDGLISDLGGPPTPAVGFSIGLERTVLSLEKDSFARAPAVFIAALGGAARLRGLVLADELRRHGNWHVELEHRSVGMKAQFKRADKLGARFVAALGDDELAAGTVRLRDMRASDETSVKQVDLAAELSRRLSAEE